MELNAVHTVSESAAPPDRAATNRHNSTFSTGPRTDDGKSISRNNSLKHGLYSQAVVLPTENPAAFDALLEALTGKFQPSTAEQHELVRFYAETRWRLDRVLATETNLLAVTLDEQRPQMQERYPAESPTVIDGFAQATAFRAEARLFEQLHRHEGRLRRLLEKTEKTLTVAPTHRAIPSFALDFDSPSMAVIEPDNPFGFVPSEIDSNLAPAPEPASVNAPEPEPTPNTAEPIGFVPSEIPESPLCTPKPVHNLHKMPKFSGPNAKKDRKRWLRDQARRTAAA